MMIFDGDGDYFFDFFIFTVSGQMVATEIQDLSRRMKVRLSHHLTGSIVLVLVLFRVFSGFFRCPSLREN